MKAAISLFILAALVAPGVADAQDPEAGERLFERCVACHTVERGGRNRVGPNLWGIFGSTAARRDTGFEKYSDALTESGIVWDAASLSAYVENPRAFIPGTRMFFAGLRDPGQRADLIAYLERATR